MDENQLAEQMWNSVAANDKKTAYSLIVRSRANVNLVYGEMPSSPFLTLGKALQQEQPVSPPDGSPKFFDCNSHDKISPREPLSPASTSSRTDDMEDGCEGLSLLHLACRVADVGMVELLLQYGASVNMNDSMGRTPLHHCILKGRHRHAKLLLSRYARTRFLRNMILDYMFDLSTRFIRITTSITLYLIIIIIRTLFCSAKCAFCFSLWAEH